MSYKCNDPKQYVGQTIGNGQCVVFIQQVTSAPHTSQWKEGIKVYGSTNIPYGTAIATFQDGKYPNNSTGNHAAIYLDQSLNCINVIDQWTGQPVHERQIQFRGEGKPSNDGMAYSVIE
jgi:hypothetical protein